MFDISKIRPGAIRSASTDTDLPGSVLGAGLSVQGRPGRHIDMRVVVVVVVVEGVEEERAREPEVEVVMEGLCALRKRFLSMIVSWRRLRAAGVTISENETKRKGYLRIETSTVF